jgi:serine phosphatase RsbU (regulator of sigma subunit)
VLPSDNTLDIVVADVSGHNIGASLIMAETRTLIQASRDQGKNPADLMHNLNNFLYDDLTRTELFISMFYISINLDDLGIRYANAGHNKPLHYQAATGSIDELDAEGMIFGVRKEIPFTEEKTELGDGDILLLYTDGITEAENPDGVFFGEDRLKELLLELKDHEAHDIINELLEQVRIFIGSHNFNDDISVVIVKHQK